jgi:hypothetical protein
VVAHKSPPAEFVNDFPTAAPPFLSTRKAARHFRNHIAVAAGSGFMPTRTRDGCFKRHMARYLHFSPAHVIRPAAWWFQWALGKPMLGKGASEGA